MALMVGSKDSPKDVATGGTRIMRYPDESCRLAGFFRNSLAGTLLTVFFTMLLMLSLFPYLMGGGGRVVAEGGGGTDFGSVINVSADPGRKDDNPVMAVCPITGSAHLAWVKSTEAGTRIYYADNQDVVFPSPIELSRETSVRDFNPRIDVDQFGRSHVAWESEVTTGRYKVRYAMVENGEVYRNDTIDARSAENDHEPDISVDDNGDAHIAFRRDLGGYFNVHYTRDTGGSFSTPINISNRTSPSDRAPLIRTRNAPDGQVYSYVAWQFNTDWQLAAIPQLVPRRP
ncbi:MAG: hypothetical protein KJ686_13955 [Actinobacteria bacterium]|nr:hypothetical protein [Actinomycetota bacterium]